MNSENVHLSVVVPLYNEEDSVKPLYDAIVNSLMPLLLKYEIIFIDDGSSDNTYEKALQLAKVNLRLKIIKLNRNYGQTAALSAGIEHAEGEYIVTMDGDLQNDPADIRRLLNKMKEGYDIVLGWRQKRKDDLFLRKIPSKIANGLIRMVTGTTIKDNGCALRICRAEIIKEFHIYSEMHRYLPVIAAMAGARMTQIEVKHHSRKFGRSKYGLSRIYKVLLDLVAIKTIWAAFYMPLYGFGLGAIACGLISVAIFIAGIVKVMLNPADSIIIISGISMLLGALSLFLILLGFICDLVYRSSSVRIENILKKSKSVEIS